MIGKWPDKLAAEKFPNAVDWSQPLAEASIISCAAEVIKGSVTIDDPAPTTFDGALQTVWVSAGEPGQTDVLCSIKTNDGRELAVIARFVIAAGSHVTPTPTPTPTPSPTGGQFDFSSAANSGLVALLLEDF